MQNMDHRQILKTVTDRIRSEIEDGTRMMEEFRKARNTLGVIALVGTGIAMGTTGWMSMLAGSSAALLAVGAAVDQYSASRLAEQVKRSETALRTASMVTPEQVKQLAGGLTGQDTDFNMVRRWSEQVARTNATGRER